MIFADCVLVCVFMCVSVSDHVCKMLYKYDIKNPAKQIVIDYETTFNIIIILYYNNSQQSFHIINNQSKGC